MWSHVCTCTVKICHAIRSFGLRPNSMDKKTTNYFNDIQLIMWCTLGLQLNRLCEVCECKTIHKTHTFTAFTTHIDVDETPNAFEPSGWKR